MKSVGLFSALVAVSVMAAPVVAQAAPAEVQRGSAQLEQGSEIRGVSLILVALVLAAILAVALGGKSHNNPVSS